MATRNLRETHGGKAGELSQPNVGVRFQGKLTRYATASVFVIAFMSRVIGDAFSQEIPLNDRLLQRDYQSNSVTNEAARLSSSVYDLKAPAGYQMINHKEGTNGFKAAAYRDASGKVFVVYAGTDKFDGRDWKGNLELAKETYLNNTNSPTLDSQTEQAINFFLETKTKEGTADIVVAGHSQGGYHAQIVGAKYNATTRTFEAPGVPQSVLDRYEITIRSSLNAVRDSSLIGNAGDHIGQTVKYEDLLMAPLWINHGIEGLANEISTGKGSIATNMELENKRADRSVLSSDNPFASIDTSSWDKQVSTYQREATAEIGDASRRIDQQWGQARQDLSRQLGQHGGAMAGAAGYGGFPSLNPPLGSASQPASSQASRSQPAASQPTRLQSSPPSGISSGQGRVNQPKQSGSSRNCSNESQPLFGPVTPCP
jgi:hypothetical protein